MLDYQSCSRLQSLHSMHPTPTVHQVLQFIRFTLILASWRPLLLCNFISPSFHPSNCPSWVLLRPWMYRIRRHRQQGQTEKTKLQPCAELISHNPHTLDPAVSSHSPSYLFPAFLTTSSYFSLPSPSSTAAASCPTALTHTRVLYLAMTMYSSATVQCHLKYNAHTLPEDNTGKAMHVHACNLALLRSLHTDTLRKWNLSLMVGEAGGLWTTQVQFLKIQ